MALTKDEEYDGLEHDSIEVMRQLLQAAATGQPIKKVLMAAAKTAQSGLGSVQSYRRTKLGTRALDFEMVRSVTRDPERLAEYIRTTAPTTGILAALPERKELS